MMKGLRKWAWVVPLMASVMVGEAYLLRGYYARRYAGSPAPNALPARDTIVVESSETMTPQASKPYAVPVLSPSNVPSTPPFASNVGREGDKQAEAETADSTATAEQPPSRSEQVIDSLEHALHEMEQVVNTLMGQINRNTRVREDTLRRRPRRQAEEPLTDVDRAIRSGRQLIDRRIRAEGIDRHLDTLSRWLYHSPQLQEQIVGINSTVYEYVEGLRMTFSDADINTIREALLDYWKAWSDRTAEKIRRLKEEDRNER